RCPEDLRLGMVEGAQVQQASAFRFDQAAAIRRAVGFGMVDQNSGLPRTLQDLVPGRGKVFVERTGPGPVTVISGVSGGRGEMSDPPAVVTDEPSARGMAPVVHAL